jgi:hypothetical protein
MLRTNRMSRQPDQVFFNEKVPCGTAPAQFTAQLSGAKALRRSTDQ